MGSFQHLIDNLIESEQFVLNLWVKPRPMRIPVLLLAIYLMTPLAGCKNAGKAKSVETDLSETAELLPDTLVHSSPDNYLLLRDGGEITEEFEVISYKDMFRLFDSLEYTPESWQAGIREIPRVYLPKIGDKWGPSSSKELTIENKKRLFFRGLAPLILRSNELIMEDRERLEGIRDAYDHGEASELDRNWITKLAAIYRVKNGDAELSADLLDELWDRVDIVPASLALGQAAEESGWGTSRFAAEGNAIYGQWTWGKDAIVPKEQRKELGNYGIAAFGSLQESVCAYMLNLNTHNAYAGLRDKRAELRASGEKVSGTVLAAELTSYSERGQAYVDGLISLMEYNQLIPVDDAYLSKNPPIYLIPVED